MKVKKDTQTTFTDVKDFRLGFELDQESLNIFRDRQHMMLSFFLERFNLIQPYWKTIVCHFYLKIEE